jgi:cysteine desulfurase
MRRIYLDHNAATPLDPRVEEAYHKALKEGWANPGSIHFEGQASKSMLAGARSRIAKVFGVSSGQVVFFSCATEALNTLICGLSGGLGAHILTSGVEHAAVWETCKFLERQGRHVTYLNVGAYGAPKIEQVEAAINEKTKAIALMSVNNETGVMTDIARISELASHYKIPFIVDAVAHFGKAPFTFFDGMSAACFSGYKVHGPSGVGFAIIQNGLLVPPLLHGGGQESGRRSGSENVAGIYATSIAVELAASELKDAQPRMAHCRDRFEKRFMEELSGVYVNGEAPRISNTSNLSFSDINGEELLIQLDLAGVSASHGAACSAGALEPSRILLEMGYPQVRAKASVRFSFGKNSTEEEVDQAVTLVIKTVRQMRRI